ncbi:MAG: aspartyl-phosphate phosphatase Spo0E family protein [Clostridiaceae bacterium]
MRNIKKDIESLRYKLYWLIENKKLTDIEVIACSQKLDKLLVKYEKNRKQ